MALAQQGRWKEAEAALSRAIEAAPRWTEGYYGRSVVRAQIAGPESRLEALTEPKPGRDYAAIAAKLREAVEDLSQVASLDPFARRRQRIKALIEALSARAEAADAAARTLLERAQAEKERRRKEAEARAREEARRREKAAQLERSRRELHEQRRELLRGRRRRALWVAGSAIVPVAIAAGLAGYGARVNSRIRSGGFATGRDIALAASSAQTANQAAYAMIGVASACVVTGAIMWLIYRDPGEYRGQVVSARRGRPGLRLLTRAP